MALRTPVQKNENGETLTFQAVTDVTGDYFVNQVGEVELLLHNSHATDDSVFTIHANGTTSVDQFSDYGVLNKTDRTITVGPGEYSRAGNFPALAYNGDTGASHSNAIGLLITATGGTPEMAGIA